MLSLYEAHNDVVTMFSKFTSQEMFPHLFTVSFAMGFVLRFSLILVRLFFSIFLDMPLSV